MTVFFLRGLSTKGWDEIYFGPLNWGVMHTHLERELTERGIRFYPILGMGSGLIDTQTDFAINFLREHPAWKQTGKVHLLGHSAGGLIAKKILQKLTSDEMQKIISVVTIATPHGGSYIAEACLQAPIRHPIFTWLLKKLGFDIRLGFPFYEQLTAATQAREFGTWNAPMGVKTASITAGSHWRFLSWPFWVARVLKIMREIPAPHDGLLEVKSQTFGQVLGHFELDHLTQLGVYRKPNFTKMCDRLAEFYRSF